MIKRKVVLFLYICLVVLTACGKKAPPIPPNVILPNKPDGLSADVKNGVVVLTFKLPEKNVDGSLFNNYKGVEVYRAEVADESSFCADCSDRYKLIYKGDSAPTAKKGYVSYADRSLTKEDTKSGGKYYYRVRIFNMDNTPQTSERGISGFSAPIKVILPDK